jgi:fucose permease
MAAALPARPGSKEYFALLLLLVGGIVLPGIGWIAGVLLLWLSHVWTTREKLIGTLLVPGGLAGAFYLMFVSGSMETCVGVSEIGSPTSFECTGGISNTEQALWVMLFILLIIAPIFTTIFLGRSVYRADRPAEA